MEADESSKPLSLNERLALSLSRSRPTSHHTTEIRVRKVKMAGRRRLCKLSSNPDDGNSSGLLSPELSSPEGNLDPDGGNSIQDIVDDLSCRLETLSVEKPKRGSQPTPHESEAEFRSAASSLSSSSPEKFEGVNGKAVERLVLDDASDDEDCVVLGSDEKSIWRDEKSNWGDCDDDAAGEIDDDGGHLIRMNGTGLCKDLRYTLPGKTAKMLYPHQKEGLKWLWSLHCGGTGGILGDDMGLGKTMQISAFLAGLFYSNLIKRVLIIAPKTLLSHWIKELSIVGLSTKIKEYCGTSLKVREHELRCVLKEGGILLSTYDIVRTSSKFIKGDYYNDDDRDEDDIIWNYTILDEGHIIKNPQTQRAKSLYEIPSSHRIIISGTPIQNNLKELWALFHFCYPELLGCKNEFKIRYEDPLQRGNDKYASDREKRVGSTVAKELRERIKPYFLRRMKSEIFCLDEAVENSKFSRKNEIIVWLKLTSVQRQLYEAFLKSEMVHSSVGGSPLASITILKKICDHPLLLTKRAAEGVLEGMEGMLNREELGVMEEMTLNLVNMTHHGVLKIGQNTSCKLSFIMSLLENLVKEGHHILIFSQTRKMLNLLEEAILSKGYQFLRIDGTTKISDREKLVKDFQEGCSVPIFLLTSQVGGLGLTLTKADRVIVVDPAWNPSTDNQSVDRAYRIGQKRDVLVYRLMTCGTVEEKIYKMQVFKGGLFRTATEQKEQTRYFSQRATRVRQPCVKKARIGHQVLFGSHGLCECDDMRELFSLPPLGFDVSLTQQQLYEEHDQHHTVDDSMKYHIEFLKSQGIAGVSHHSLLFSKASTVPISHENEDSKSLSHNCTVGSLQSKPSVESAINGSEFAFNPKDRRLFSQAGSSLFPEQQHLKEKPELIEERILRLSQTLENNALVSKLPDQGEKLRKQISELKTQLEKNIEPIAAVTNKAFQGREHKVIDLDDLSNDFDRIVSFPASK